MTELLFVAAGLASGFFSGALGVGGAALATPLVRFLGVDPFLAIGSTVPAILPSTLTGAYTYARAGLIDRRSVMWTSLGGTVTTIAGAFSTRLIAGDGHLLMVATAAVLVFLSLRVIPGRDHLEPESVPRTPALGLAAVGGTAGFFSGLLGIGGGFLMVPLFLKVMRMPTKVALGTSLASISIMVLPNIWAQWAVGNIDWKVAALLAAGVVPGARAGAKVAIRTDQRPLRIAIAASLATVAVVFGVYEALALVRQGISF